MMINDQDDLQNDHGDDDDNDGDDDDHDDSDDDDVTDQAHSVSSSSNPSTAPLRLLSSTDSDRLPLGCSSCPECPGGHLLQ